MCKNYTVSDTLDGMVGWLLILVSAAFGADQPNQLIPDPFCDGYCSHRYQAGYKAADLCACVDFLKPPVQGRIEVPKRVKREDTGHTASYNLDLAPYLRD